MLLKNVLHIFQIETEQEYNFFLLMCAWGVLSTLAHVCSDECYAVIVNNQHISLAD